jgi:hypothetical protein
MYNLQVISFVLAQYFQTDDFLKSHPGKLLKEMPKIFRKHAWKPDSKAAALMWT